MISKNFVENTILHLFNMKYNFFLLPICLFASLAIAVCNPLKYVSAPVFQLLYIVPCHEDDN